MSDISVEIGHLVLDGIGVEPANSHRFGQMTESALQRLLEQQGLPSGIGGCDVAEIAAPTISFPSAATEVQIAQKVAQAIYRAIDRAGQ